MIFQIIYYQRLKWYSKISRLPKYFTTDMQGMLVLESELDSTMVPIDTYTATAKVITRALLQKLTASVIKPLVDVVALLVLE
jgi:hypothetical protein